MITHDQLLFTPEEAVKLGRKHGALGTIEVVTDIAEAWGNQYEDQTFNYYCMLSAIFDAGYLQGKREERKRQAERKAKRERKERELYSTSEIYPLRSMVKFYADRVDSKAGLTMMKDLCFTIWHSWKFKGKYQDN